MRIDPVTWNMTADLTEARRRITGLEIALERHEALARWFRGRRCYVCGAAFADPGADWCELHPLVWAAWGERDG